MDPRAKEIQRLEAELKELDQQLRSEYVDVGARLQSRPPGEPPPEPLSRYLRNIQALVRSREELEGHIEQIRALVTQHGETQKKIEETRERMTALQQERNAAAAELGAAAYRRFRELSEPAEYKEVFADVLTVDREIDELRRRIARIDEEERNRGFLHRLVSRGRTMGLRSALARQEKLKEEKYQAAGYAVAATDFSKYAQGELRYMFDLMLQRGREIDECQQKIEALEAQDRGTQEALTALGAWEDHAGRIRELQERMRSTDREIELLRMWAGQAFVEQDAHHRIPDPMLRGKAELITSLKSLIGDKRRRIEHLRALIEIDGLRERLKSLQRKREQVEAEIRSREEQIRTLSMEVDRVESRIRELQQYL